MAWSPESSCGFESRKIKYLIPRYTRGRGLEIGCGQEKAFPHFIGVDNGHHFGRGAADVMMEADNLSLFADNSLDFVFSSHVLEHMVDMEKTLSEWGRVIKPGGYLVLYVPSANLYPKCGEPGANPDHKHDIYPGDIARMLDNGPFIWTPIETEERGEENEYSLFEVYLKGRDKNKFEHGTYDGVTIVDSCKTACVVRFGGFGDMLQAALSFPGLKKQGYHLTVMTTPRGKEIIEHDPTIDDWFILDTDQIPNHELTQFWYVQSKRFDRFINLSESVEGTLLAIPGRSNHAWTHEVRHQRMNKNYHEFTCELAGVPMKPERLFYQTQEESNAMSGLLLRYGANNFNIVWALSGSALHKFSPHMDAVIARIMLEIPEAIVYLVGDEACQVLEQGWQQEARVVCLSGTLSIRQTLALAELSQLVIGPETGVLNAVAFDERVSKVIMLSHSSANNLTKHWVRTQALTPKNCACYPCHQMHYNSFFCDEDEATGASRCAINIDPKEIWEAVAKVYRNWRAKQ